MSVLASLFGVTGIKDLVLGVLDRIKLAPEKRAEIELKLLEHQQALAQFEADLESRVTEQSGQNIRAEIASGSWLGRNWRPYFCFGGATVLLFNLAAPMVAQIFGRQLSPVPVPGEFYWLFGAGFLGYGGMRTWEKIMGRRLGNGG